MSTELIKLLPRVTERGARPTVVLLLEPAVPRVHIPRQLIESIRK